jgi:dCTP deaminase
MVVHGPRPLPVQRHNPLERAQGRGRESKSSLARLGIGMHVTAPTIHAGFGYKKDDDTYPGSPLQLEIWNVGALDVKLEAEKPVCQLIFEIVDGTPEKGYEGRFSIQGPSTPAP